MRLFSRRPRICSSFSSSPLPSTLVFRENNLIMKLFALIATISSASALKTRGGIKATQALTVPRGGGVDVEQIATWVGLASSGFILLPAGRDVVAMETPILPGDEELIAAMTMANPDARRWIWGMWGLNHCFLAVLKLQAINQKDKAMLKKLLIPTAATFLYCVLGQSDMGGAADLGGFIAVCGLQTLAIGYLAYN
mmetsp:Transcript_6449/g.16379  ORF Transcript_6449/g.16379 Transcript_6449/m.16379 type:complete len:196 (+) Transcript_6449:3-590(+)